MDSVDFWLPLFPVLYAEMHYTLRGFSRVYRPWPEIIADAPHRVEPDKSIPLLILVKDAHRFPVIIHDIVVELFLPDGRQEKRHLISGSIEVSNPTWSETYFIDLDQKFSGNILLDVAITCQRRGKKKVRTFHADNYKFSSHQPLKVHVSSDPVPRFQGWYYGDLHYHSDFTHDQAEFGAPLKDTVHAANAIGLSFTAVTDHSYDLDDTADNYLEQDASLKKWHLQKKMIAEMDSKSDFVFIRGEEVSAGNSRKQNVHMLVINSDRFYHGSGDSAERWFRTTPENSIQSILDDLPQEALAFAAHPEEPFTILHQILLRRGKWHSSDYDHSRLKGMQVLNGVIDGAFHRGIKQWIRQLSNGKKLILIAGNDAHGNFNRFRQLGLPFLTFRESHIHLFGKARTGVFCDSDLRRETILQSLRDGKCMVTTGPALDLTLLQDGQEDLGIGGTLKGNAFKWRIQGRTSVEFGDFQNCRIWLGQINDNRDKETLLKEITTFEAEQDFDLVSASLEVNTACYIRAELYTQRKNHSYFCLTNPIWIDPS